MTNPSETRDRLGAVGCGTVALLFGAFLFLATGSGIWRGETAVSIAIASVALLLVVIGLVAYGLAVRARGDDDDDLLHGPRGTALAASLVSIAAVLSLVLVALFNLDFWRGLID